MGGTHAVVLQHQNAMTWRGVELPPAALGHAGDGGFLSAEYSRLYKYGGFLHKNVVKYHNKIFSLYKKDLHYDEKKCSIFCGNVYTALCNHCCGFIDKGPLW